jgi:catechol 2,3-dioxygenase-like lactoylglutathione lyase family enzyme
MAGGPVYLTAARRAILGPMPTRLVHLVVDANDPVALARFWASALDWVVADETEEEIDIWPPGFSYPGTAAVPLLFVPVPEAKTAKNQVHLDLASTSAAHQAELVARLTGLGASRLDIGQGDVPWTVMADPEGNEFCVLEPREVYRGTGPVAAIVADCGDPARLARFWTAAAGWQVLEEEDGFAGLRSPDGAGPFLEFLRVPGQRLGKNRLHPDVAPFAADDQAGEVSRLLLAGAGPADVGQGTGLPWTVLADPEGNELCVLTPR